MKRVRVVVERPTTPVPLKNGRLTIRHTGTVVPVRVYRLRLLLLEAGKLDVVMDGVFLQTGMSEFEGLSIVQNQVVYKGQSGIDKALDELLQAHVSLLMRIENQQLVEKQQTLEFLARLKARLTTGATMTATA